MTLTELARLAHVSTSTASKAFAFSPEVNEQTRNLIFEVAKANGCFKKFYSSEYPGLFFAIIFPEFESTYYSAFISALQKALSHYNAEIAVASTGFDRKTEERLIDYYSRYNTADGIIIIDGYTALKSSSDIPIITVNHLPAQKGHTNINVGSQKAIRTIIEYWANAGVTEIGFIGDCYTEIRLNSLKQALELSNLPIREDLFITTNERFEHCGYAGARRLIANGKLPRALFCAYDRIAIGAIRAFSEMGINVPDDVAIFSVDDAPFTTYSTPSITSISPRIDEVCSAVVNSLMAKIKGEPLESEITIDYELKLRESSVIK